MVNLWDWHQEGIDRGVYSLFRHNLCAGKADKVLLLTDTYKERVGELMFHYGSPLCGELLHHTYQPTGRHGLEPPESVWRAAFGPEFVQELKEKGLLEKVLKKELTGDEEAEVKELLLETTAPEELPTAVIAVNRYSISHTLFRKLCTDFLSIRFASMPLFEPFMFSTSLRANWSEVERRSNAVADLLSRAVGARLVAPNGTDLTFSLEGRSGIADTGRICSPGDFGNLPAGEAFVAPVEGSGCGLLVVEYAPDRKLDSPVKLRFEGGKVVEVEGEEPFADYLRELFSREEGASNLAEFGVGTNDRAKVKTNILEAEKILGTCHVAVGDNSSFGGRVKANVHIDFLVEEPTVTLTLEGGEELTLLEEGKLKV